MHMNGLGGNFCKEMCSQYNLEHNTLRPAQVKYYFLMKKNQRADCTRLRTLTEGGITKLATSDCLSGLWWLILCQKNHSHCKRRKSRWHNGRLNYWSQFLVSCDIIIYSCMASRWVKPLCVDLGLHQVICCDQWDVSESKVNRGWNVLTWLDLPLSDWRWEQPPMVTAHSAGSKWDPNWRAADPNSEPGAQHSQPAIESTADH